MKLRLPSTTKNWLTIIGAIIAVINFLLIILLFIISTVFSQANTSLGLYIYIILPGFLVLGLIMIPVGMLGERRRMLKKTEPTPQRSSRRKKAFMKFPRKHFAGTIVWALQNQIFK